MARYIDADAALDKQMTVGICDAQGNFYGADDMVLVSDIIAIPTADVQEVRHGKWVYHYRLKKFVCLECGYEQKHKPEWNYCPKCGAKMDGKDD